MAMVVVDDSCLQLDSQPKSARWLGLSVDGRLCAALQFIKWTGWTLAITCGHDDSTINIVQRLLLLLLRMLTAKFYASSLIHCSVLDDPCPYSEFYIYINENVKILWLIDWLIGWLKTMSMGQFTAAPAAVFMQPAYFSTSVHVMLGSLKVFQRATCSDCWRETRYTPDAFPVTISLKALKGGCMSATPERNLSKSIVDIWIVNMWNGNWPLEPELSLLSANKKKHK